MRRAVAFLVLASAAVLTAPPVRGQEVEEILSYDVTIEVAPGGAMDVTERLRVRVLGDQIRRGIYRDFPTSFPRVAGLGRIEAPFDVISVRRDGSPEPYALEAVGGPLGRGGVRVRVGDANVMLDPGVHDFEIRYATDRWFRFGNEGDQLYWNVTGNGWGFPIRSASARVHIPEVTARPTLESWTGYEGSTTTSATATWDAATREAVFETDTDLPPGEGLTVRVTFPSGQLTPPAQAQQEVWFRLDWGGYVDAGYVVLFVIAMYLLMWRRVGMDPAPGPTRLRREPPPGYSPAAIGFIERRGYHMSQLSAALVSMALKGAIRIDHDGSKWKLYKTDKKPDDLTPEETELYEGLLGSRRMIELEQSRHATLRSAIKRFKRSLGSRLEREYFENNRRWFLAGLAISVVGFGALAWRWRFGLRPEALFLGVWLTGWTAGVSTLAYRLVQVVRTAKAGGGAAAWAGAGFLALFSVPFFAGEIIVGGILSTMVPRHLLVGVIGVGVTNVVFYHLLERPTLKGRGVLDRVEGFRSFLGGSDDRALHPREDRVALFEQFLPFAIALGLEQRWSEAFGDVLLPALANPSGRSGRPWYTHDHGRSFTPSSFASSLGSSLSSTLSSASSPPSSSGGAGGGGGSSGGGGGGGGGGGW